MRFLTDWLDDRTGYRGITKAMLYEHIPGGSRWRYVWGSTLVFTFVVQMVTGFALWMHYSPSSHSAWESVYFIQNQMWGGALLRGIHHYTAHMMIVLVALHMGQVIIDGAYRAPREFNFWIGLILLMILLGLSLTGYLLPWDQKGYWATQVATNIMAVVPFVGPQLQSLVVGGSEYGHHTLTRFFALHAGLLPFLMISFTAVHIYFFRRHGIKHKEPRTRPDETFWVDQVLKDAVACLGVMVVVLLLVFRYKLVPGGSDYVGAELGAPADPAEPYNSARPEWYFLFLFQFLKLEAFKGAAEVWGAVYVPGLVFLVLALMPFIGLTRAGHRFNMAVFGVIFAGVIVLTSLAIREDFTNREYAIAVRQAERDAHRAAELAGLPAGIPPTGAVTLMRNDPYTQGPKLFAMHCAACHRHGGTNGLGELLDPEKNPVKAPDLKGFASREWIAGLLDPKQVDQPHYFGNTKFKNGRMVKFVKGDVAEYDAEAQEQLRKAVLALSAEAQLPGQRDADAKDAAAIEEGRKVLQENDAVACLDCHSFRETTDSDNSPDLSGYGSRQWTIDFISNPAHERFYGKRNDGMPAFGEKKLLTAREIELVTDWLRGDWTGAGHGSASSDAPASTRPTTRGATVGTE